MAMDFATIRGLLAAAAVLATTVGCGGSDSSGGAGTSVADGSGAGGAADSVVSAYRESCERICLAPVPCLLLPYDAGPSRAARQWCQITCLENTATIEDEITEECLDATTVVVVCYEELTCAPGPNSPGEDPTCPDEELAARCEMLFEGSACAVETEAASAVCPTI
jgi:hypothetical protein